jgi:hypothetical protein
VREFWHGAGDCAAGLYGLWRHAGELIRRIRDCDDAMMETIVVPLRTDLKQPLRW